MASEASEESSETRGGTQLLSMRSSNRTGEMALGAGARVGPPDGRLACPMADGAESRTSLGDRGGNDTAGSRAVLSQGDQGKAGEWRPGEALLNSEESVRRSTPGCQSAAAAPLPN